MMVKIYKVSAWDVNGLTRYYCATKKEAETIVREMRNVDFDPWEEITIEELEVAQTREGIAQALQDVITLTCFNDK